MSFTALVQNHTDPLNAVIDISRAYEPLPEDEDAEEEEELLRGVIGCDTQKRWLHQLAFAPPVYRGNEKLNAATKTIVFSSPSVFLLYGRKGSGKSTLLHAKRCHAISSNFGIVYDFKLREWNHAVFLEWAAKTVAAINSEATRKSSGKTNDRTLVLLANVHRFSYMRDPVYINTLLHLLKTVHAYNTRRVACQSGGDVRVLMTCDEVPTVLPLEVRSEIDSDCYMPPLEPVHVTRLIMRQIHSLFMTTKDPRECNTNNNPDRWKSLEFEIDACLDAPQTDPDHIANLLTIAAQGASPWEIVTFMRRVADTCSNPNPDGGTDYNEALFEKMLHDIEGGKSVTPYNPAKDNAAFQKYVGIFVPNDADDPPMVSANGRDNKKRARPEDEEAAAGQGGSKQEAITAMANKRERILRNAAERELKREAMRNRQEH